MPEPDDSIPERAPAPRERLRLWPVLGLVVTAAGLWLATRPAAEDKAPAADSTARAHASPAMMNNMTRYTIQCVAADSDSRILIAPYSRSFVAAGPYRCRPPVPPDPITLRPGGSLDFEADGGRITIRRPSAYSS